MASASAARTALDAERDVLLHALALLLGGAPDLLANELAAAPPATTAPPAITPGLPSELLNRRPDIRAAERRLAAASAEIGVATADRLPKLNLTGAADLVSTALARLISGDSAQLSLAAGVTAPLLDGGRGRATVRLREEAYREARTRLARHGPCGTARCRRRAQPPNRRSRSAHRPRRRRCRRARRARHQPGALSRRADPFSRRTDRPGRQPRRRRRAGAGARDARSRHGRPVQGAGRRLAGRRDGEGIMSDIAPAGGRPAVGRRAPRTHRRGDSHRVDPRRRARLVVATRDANERGRVHRLCRRRYALSLRAGRRHGRASFGSRAGNVSRPARRCSASTRPR